MAERRPRQHVGRGPRRRHAGGIGNTCRARLPDGYRAQVPQRGHRRLPDQQFLKSGPQVAQGRGACEEGCGAEERGGQRGSSPGGPAHHPVRGRLVAGRSPATDRCRRGSPAGGRDRRRDRLSRQRRQSLPAADRGDVGAQESRHRLGAFPSWRGGQADVRPAGAPHREHRRERQRRLGLVRRHHRLGPGGEGPDRSDHHVHLCIRKAEQAHQPSPVRPPGTTSSPSTGPRTCWRRTRSAGPASGPATATTP